MSDSGVDVSLMSTASNLVQRLGIGVASIGISDGNCTRHISVQFTDPMFGAMAAFALNGERLNQFDDFQTWTADYAGVPVILYGPPRVEYRVEWPGTGGCRIVLENGAVLGHFAHDGDAHMAAFALGFYLTRKEPCPECDMGEAVRGSTERDTGFVNYSCSAGCGWSA